MPAIRLRRRIIPGQTDVFVDPVSYGQKAVEFCEVAFVNVARLGQASKSLHWIERSRLPSRGLLSADRSDRQYDDRNKDGAENNTSQHKSFVGAEFALRARDRLKPAPTKCRPIVGAGNNQSRCRRRL